MQLAGALLVSLIWPAFVAGYSFNITSTPKQCQNLTIEITGSGSPPYRVLIIPYGPSPLANDIEARRIVDQAFSGTSVSFQLKFPTNSQFVAVVSDSTGFGTGGTSVAGEVLSSSDSSCFDSTTSVSPTWVFNINPPNQIVQCQATRIWWDPAQIQGTGQFQGVIPGGQSFSIPLGPLTTVAEQGSGFNWTPNVRTQTTLIIVGGDDRGEGSAGSIVNTVGGGTNPSSSCLNDTSPSSTPGSPAGGSYPTSTSGAGTGNDGGGQTVSGGGSHSTNVAAIVGGVIGGIAIIIILGLLLLFFTRRKHLHKTQKERPIDLLHDEDESSDERRELPQYYQPEPFVVPDPTIQSSDHGHGNHPPSAYHGGATVTGTSSRPISLRTSTEYRSPTPDQSGATSNSARKSATGPILRPVNIIQHDDAGPSLAQKEEEQSETIELPPAYTNIKK